MAVIMYYRGKSFYNQKNDLKAFEDFEYAVTHQYEVCESTFYIGVILLSMGDVKKGCFKLLESKALGAKHAEEYLTKYCE